MSKLTTAEDKLLKRGFDWATDSNGYDPSWDEMDVLKYLNQNPGEILATKIARAINIPVHRVIAARNRLETAGKLPTVQLDNVIDFRPEQSDLPIVETCSTGNERSCVNDETEPGTLVKILDSDGLWKIDTIKDGYAKVDLVEGDRKLPKRRRVALHKLRVNVVLGETVQSVYDIPHWLTGKNAAEAKALIDLGFWCVGSVDNWGEPEQSKIIETSGDWSFNYDYIGMFIEARCNGAVFNIDVEETNEEQDKELVNKAVATIKKAAEDWGLQFGQQLTIFDCEQTQNREQENILLTDPPRQVDANGQLSIFFDDSEEPPDPDDFETGEEYEQAYDKWAALYPEIERAINQAKVREFQNTHWSTGDYVEKVGKSKGKILENSERKRPAKGCGSGSLVVRQANKKRNAAKGRDPDIYYVYCYSYTDNYGKEIKSSISVPREKIAHVKGMIERKEHYVKIAKFLGKSLPCYY